ncbi:icme protein [Lasius niger]|uniref:Icme protein n=1 Tax=Lasius niger TaxID=67767 RepID=A0A0J7KEP5_LASNI|nr:icme protein [Lasius niger]
MAPIASAAYVEPPVNDTTLFAGDIQNATGDVIGSIDPSGNITDASTGNNIGTVNAQGKVFDSFQHLLGSVPAGEKNAAFALAKNALRTGAPPTGFSESSAGDFAGQVKDDNGIVLGNIDPTGAITEIETGEYIGRVQANGQVFADDGEGLGSVDLGDQMAAYKMAKAGPAKPEDNG